MRFIIQRVTRASCRVDHQVIGEIEAGYCVFIGISERDTVEIADKMVSKMLGLRIFSDDAGKTNLSISDVGGSLLLISQFTLYADCRKGNRPSFTKAGNPQLAESLYNYIIEKCRETSIDVQTGSFGADMKISLENDGPFTVILDSDELGIHK